MCFRLRASVAVLPFVALSLILVRPVLASPTVWSGLTTTFAKPAFANPQIYKDQITSSVALSRGSTQGMLNVVSECSSGCAYTHNVSPAGTMWATDLVNGNAGKSIAAANWSNLNFTNWETAYGASSVLQGNIVTQDAVVHLVADDIYLDLRFTMWGGSGASGGSFTYMRAERPPSGDYSGNGVVDAADYTVWRDTLGQAVDTAGQGADGDKSGMIDARDYTYWKDRFGNTVPGAGALQATAVPEPATIVIALVGGLAANVMLHFRQTRLL